MPEPTITRPPGVWDAGATWGNFYPSVGQQTHMVRNDPAGTTRTAGDVVSVALDANGNLVAQVPSGANDKAVYGVVAPEASGSTQTAGDTYTAGQDMPVIINGVGRINVAANVVAAKDVLTTTATAAAAVNAGAPAANAVVGSLIAVALEASTAKDVNNTIRAIIGKF